ncbi:MAG: hypothetical protein LH654_13960 [Thermoleophilia bacterium]|nr:hypothetical protein [Thermoleophilia bacterium]
MKCFCHFPEGTEAVLEVEGDPLTRGNQISIRGYNEPWYVMKHTPTAAEGADQTFDAEIWVDRAAPPPPADVEQ